LFFKIYCQDVKSDIDLSKFGIKQSEISKSSNYITLEFVHHELDRTSNYLNHQTFSDNDFGYYFSEKIALFEILSGSKIVIKYFNKIDNDLIHTLLNYPFAILFNQRKKFVIHASCVLFNEKVFCFCGQTQSGKSSLSSYLIKNGGFLISEDTCVFETKDTDICVLPSYNFIKISDEVNMYKNISFKDPINFEKKIKERRGYILDNNKFHKKLEKVNYFVYLEWSQDSPKLQKLNNKISLRMLQSNEFISFSKDNAAFKFKVAADLVNQADHFIYSRRKELKSLDSFLETFPRKIS
tara:strand:+ start:205 stop:1092 length:888 start_codon:yes stop_codon:yes gene_type:complete